MANALHDAMRSRSGGSGINIKKSKRGSLHKALGIPEGRPIPTSTIRSRLQGASGNMREKLQFALTAKTKFNR